MQVQQVEITGEHNNAVRRLAISQDVRDKIRDWAYQFTFAHSSRSDMVFKSPRNKVEIWEIRVPDPSKRKGASGGYRMLCFYLPNEQTMFLDYIWSREELNKPKIKQEYGEYLKKLKGYLQKTYDPN